MSEEGLAPIVRVSGVDVDAADGDPIAEAPVVLEAASVPLVLEPGVMEPVEPLVAPMPVELLEPVEPLVAPMPVELLEPLAPVPVEPVL